jgi:hypothetical protein
MQFTKIIYFLMVAFCSSFAQNNYLFTQILQSSDPEHKLYTSELNTRMNLVSSRFAVIQMNQNIFQGQLIAVTIPIFSDFKYVSNLIKQHNNEMNIDNWIQPDQLIYYYINLVVQNNSLIAGGIFLEGKTYTIEPYLNGTFVFWENKKTAPR